VWSHHCISGYSIEWLCAVGVVPSDVLYYNSVSERQASHSDDNIINHALAHCKAKATVLVSLIWHDASSPTNTSPRSMAGAVGSKVNLQRVEIFRANTRTGILKSIQTATIILGTHSAPSD
jgi:hypothetical protein